MALLPERLKIAARRPITGKKRASNSKSHFFLEKGIDDKGQNPFNSAPLPR